MQGVVLINKPAGITSFDVVRRLRNISGIRKIGHAGTLDPFATGLLVVCISRQATKYIEEFSCLDKTYSAVLKLGEKTDTADPEGTVIEVKDIPEMRPAKVEEVFSSFKGEMHQTPPQFSAIKKDGVRLYKTARKGIRVEIEPRKIHIHSLEFVSYEEPFLTFRTHVSKGTYVRTLGEDIAAKLGTTGHLVELKRDAIGPFCVEHALNLEGLTLQHLSCSLLSVEEMIGKVKQYSHEKSA